MIELDSLIVNLRSKVEPNKLATLLGYNVSLLYQDAQAGRLPSPLTEHTYIECTHFYLKYYKKQTDLKKLRLEQEQELKLAKAGRTKEGAYAGDSDGGLPPLLAAKAKQEIRLNIAKEAQLWQRSAIDRGDYISVKELSDLVEPFITTIRNSLLTIALESQETQEQIDIIMDSLCNLGELLLEQAEEERKGIVKKILDREVDYSDISAEADIISLL